MPELIFTKVGMPELYLLKVGMPELLSITKVGMPELLSMTKRDVTLLPDALCESLEIQNPSKALSILCGPKTSSGLIV